MSQTRRGAALIVVVLLALSSAELPSGAMAEDPRESAPNPTNRTRAPLAHLQVPPAPEHVEWNASTTRDGREQARTVDWWPFALRPPFGRLLPDQRRKSASVMIGNAKFDTRSGPPPLPPELKDPRPLSEGGGYYVVHALKPFSAQEIRDLSGRGIHVISHVPRQSYLVKTDASVFPELSASPAVDGIYRYQPAYKISPAIGRSSVTRDGRTAADDLRLRLIAFPGERPSRIADQVRHLGGEVLSFSDPAPLDPGRLPDGRGRARPVAYVEIRIPFKHAGRVIPALARLDGVRWIDEAGAYRLASDWTVSGWNMGGSRSAGADFLSVRQPWNNGLRGEGVLIGNVDTGIDFDHTYLADPYQPAVVQENPATAGCPGVGPKNTPKVPYYHLAPPFDAITPVCYDQTSESGGGSLFGHGTATAGLIAADPSASDNSSVDLSSGAAPEAQLWMYDVGAASGSNLALDAAALIDELAQMGSAGASAVNLAFSGNDVDGDYDFLAEILDLTAWNHSNLLPVQAAGNDGSDGGAGVDGSVDSTGKSVLSVGGNLDDSPNVFYTPSARGRTQDGRHKPEILSPALNTINVPSANSELDETLRLLSSDGNINSDNSGFLSGPEGTSFSCASATGLAGIVAQYFKDGFYPTGTAAPADAFVPANHLVKGIIVNSAIRLTSPGIADDSRPGRAQGWGRVLLNDPLYFSQDPDTADDARKLIVFEGSFPQGVTACPVDSEIFTFDLFNVEEGLRVTLSWTDYPGDSSNPAADQIVNDLDLVVTAPGGTTYLGNDFDAAGTGFSTTGGAADRVNTVENVWLPPGETLPTGEYAVEVCPFAINDGVRQPFSLIVTGGVQGGEKVRLNQPGYTCEDTVGIEVEDLGTTSPTVDVVLASLGTGDVETVSLVQTGPTGLYGGTIATVAAAGPPATENGTLEVVDGETVEVTYLNSIDRALIDCSPAVCFEVDLGPLLQHECDHDGFADNGETIHLSLPLRNSASFPVDGATAVLLSGNPNVSVESSTATYGTIPAGAVAWPADDGTDDPFVIAVSGAVCDESATLTLSLIDGSGWTSSPCAVSDVDLRLNRDPVPLQTWDFDDGSPQGWTHEMSHGTRPLEECGGTYFDQWNTFPTTVRAQSGTYSMQLGDGSYLPLLDASLVSPSLAIPSGGARLKFYYWMEADTFDAAQVWHGFIVEVSTNGGQSWTAIEPVGGYNALASRNDCQFLFPFASTAPDFLELFGGDGDGTDYTGDTFDREWVVDLVPYASQAVQVRFRFGSDDFAVDLEGLYIDTIELEGFQCETPDICDDGDPCTTETCDPDAGGCLYDPEPDGTVCDDGEACTANDECAAGTCLGSDIISCDDGNGCTDDRAEDDGDEVCDNPATDCLHENNTAPCDDGSACTLEDICSNGSCVSGQPPDCEDLNPCTDQSCDPASGCVYTDNTNPCGDPYACTQGDVCIDGQCIGTPDNLLCDDGNVCTAGVCDPGGAGAGVDGCSHVPVVDGTSCDDATVCTLADSCQAGTCVGSLLDCSDGVSCTADDCDSVVGCSNPGIDEDGDGYDLCGTGDPVNPDGLETDCNDLIPGINPGAEEDCFNFKDDDCNGLIDAADPLGCPRSDISGTVIYYRTSAGAEPGDLTVPGTTMDLIGTATGATVTDAAGNYGFLNILKGQVSVIPTKIGDFGNAISSLDAARVSQHRVGLITLTPRQQIAGDASGNGTISSYDAALISQFRVGLISRLPVATIAGFDWFFEPEQRDYAPLDSDRLGEDYLAILYGDVTGNWTPPVRGVEAAARSDGDAADGADKNASAVPGESRRVRSCELSLRRIGTRLYGPGRQRFALYAEGGTGILGLDLNLRYSPESLSIVSVSTTDRTSSFNLATHDLGGVVKVSLYGTRPLGGSGSLLEFVVQPRKSGTRAKLSFEALVNERAVNCGVKP